MLSWHGGRRLLRALHIDQRLAMLYEVGLHSGNARGQFHVTRILQGELFYAKKDRLELIQVSDLVDGRTQPP